MIQSVAHGEVALSSGACEFVPGASQLAVIAAVDAIADGTAKLERDRSGEFDGEIGNAASGVEPVRAGMGRRKICANGARRRVECWRS